MGCEKQNLFEARCGGYHTYRIPGIVATRNGVVLVTTEARPGVGGDYDYNDLLMRRSTDGGKIFSPAVKLVDHATYGDGPVSNCMMIPDLVSGRVMAVFCHDYARVFAMSSDDDGNTWQRGDIVCRHGDVLNGVTVVNPSETTAVELADGRVMFNMRSESKVQRRLVAVSPDGVLGWKGHRWDTELREPVCMASILRTAWPEGCKPGQILFVNPDNIERSMQTAWGGAVQPPNCDRKRLTVKLSTDDGQTWPMAKVLEEGPAGYSDLAQGADGTIFCLYECDQVTGMFDDRYLRLARFDEAFIRA